MTAVATLDRTERWMQSVITHPLGVEAGVVDPGARHSIDVAPTELESIVRRSQDLTAAERLGIYHNAYFARLVECLQGDFPVFRETVGDDAFRLFALEYITKHPSRSYTLGRLGAGFVDFLRESCPAAGENDASGAAWSEFLIELARFERIVAEVFDGPGIEREPGLGADSLQFPASDDLSRLRFIGAPCLRLLQLQFAVHDWVQQNHDIALADVLQPRDTYVVVTRTNYRVIWQEVEPDEFALLQQVIAGAALRDAVTSAIRDSTGDIDLLASRLELMFSRWATLRLFVGIA